MSNRISFDQYTEERKDGPTFPAPPDHPQEAAPPTDDVLTERIRTAESEGRWDDALILKGTAPQPVQADSSDDPSGDDAPDTGNFDAWREAPGVGPQASDATGDGDDSDNDQDDSANDNANDDSNDGEDDQ